MNEHQLTLSAEHDSGRAKAVIGDACDLETRFPCAAGVISLFGLQQLPDAHLALANWVRALAPGEFSCTCQTCASQCCSDTSGLHELLVKLVSQMPCFS